MKRDQSQSGDGIFQLIRGETSVNLVKLIEVLMDGLGNAVSHIVGYVLIDKDDAPGNGCCDLFIAIGRLRVGSRRYLS